MPTSAVWPSGPRAVPPTVPASVVTVVAPVIEPVMELTGPATSTVRPEVGTMAADVKVPPVVRPAWATWAEDPDGAAPPFPEVPFCAAPAAVATKRTAPAPSAVAPSNFRVH